MKVVTQINFKQIVPDDPGGLHVITRPFHVEERGSVTAMPPESKLAMAGFEPGRGMERKLPLKAGKAKQIHL